MQLNDETKQWLLTSTPYTRYKTLTDLLGFSEAQAKVAAAKQELTEMAEIKALIANCSQWFPKLSKRHDDSQLSHYQLRMLLDFGFKASDPEMKPILNSLKAHLKDGLYAIRQEIPEKGAPKDSPEQQQWNALPCDAPLLSFILFQMGDASAELNQSEALIRDSWRTPAGWFCDLPFVKGQRKKLGAACPMAGLMALELFSSKAEWKEGKLAEHAFEALNYHFKSKSSLYYFGRGKRFWTFKYPFVWYNALYVAEVLSRYEQFHHEAILVELRDWILSSHDGKGRFMPSSMFRAYKNWEFSNKKAASPWISFLCVRILKRLRYLDVN